MHILGVSCFYHDAAAALIRDGMLVAAAEEERFSRRKHDSSFPSKAIDFCLSRAGIEGRVLDFVVFYEKPLLKYERLLMTALATFPRSCRVFRESMVAWFNEKLWIKSRLMSHLGLPAENVLFVEHHLSHAASAFFCSPFEQAAVLTIDGVGEWTTAAVGSASADWAGNGRNELVLSHEIRFPDSLGLLYSAFTAFLGFEVNEGEYKVMGMASYGRPRYLERVRKVVQVCSDGSFQLDLDYFSFHTSTRRSFSPRFLELFGDPRPPESEFATAAMDPAGEHPRALHTSSQYFADVAASLQRVTETIVLGMARRALEESGMKKLCMAGGVAMNSVANGRLLRELGLEDLYIQPAAGDSGGALGAALYAYHVLLQRPRQFVMEHCFQGASYGEDSIRKDLEECGLYFLRLEDDALVPRVVDRLASGKVAGWFQGRFEWGPRALGNRSILADPRRAEMKEIVNRKIKFREPFRPFAPALAEEAVSRFFPGLARDRAEFPLRFMQLVLPWESAAGQQLPAVNHQGTARLQVVKRDSESRFYDLIAAFGQQTGVPVLMNTSFNLRGEPMVAAPGEAIRTFLNSGLDILVLENFMVEKA